MPDGRDLDSHRGIIDQIEDSIVTTTGRVCRCQGRVEGLADLMRVVEQRTDNELVRRLCDLLGKRIGERLSG